MMVILIILAILAIAVLAVVFSLRFIYGAPIEKLLPEKQMGTGDVVHIFLNGKFNRTAKISKITQDCLYIYGSFSLPITYRGKFYATARLEDGSRLVYVGNRNHFKNVRAAEVLRKLFNFLDSPFQLVPDEPIKLSGEGNEREEYVDEDDLETEQN